MTNNIKPTEAWAVVDDGYIVESQFHDAAVYFDDGEADIARLKGTGEFVQRVYIVPAEEWERLRDGQ